jgi:hypothetical protein
MAASNNPKRAFNQSDAHPNADGSFTFTGRPGFLGSDSFEYTLEDGNGGFDM